MASLEQRLGRLELLVPSPSAPPPPDPAWEAAFDALVATMAPEHVTLLALGIDQAIREHDGPTTPTPALRLYAAFVQRLQVRTDPTLEQQHHRPLALPPAVVEVYLLDGTDGLFVGDYEQCADCAYLLPVAGKNPVAYRGPDGVWRWDDGTPAPAQRFGVVGEVRCGWAQFRRVAGLDHCPLCGGAVVSRHDFRREGP